MTGDAPLSEIALRHRTDKAQAHSYTAVYERFLEPIRREPIRVLEIGIGGWSDPAAGGESLRMWEEYFPRAEIWGLDLYEKRGLALGERVRIRSGSQADPLVLDALLAESGGFDFVVDDGSHRCEDVIATFQYLFPRLPLGALYFVEDVQTSYWPFFSRSLRRNSSKASMPFFKGLADRVNYAEWDRPAYQPTALDRSVVGLHFFHNLVVVERGTNVEPSNVVTPHPQPWLPYLQRRTKQALLISPLGPSLQRMRAWRDERARKR